jgi:23S rRNA (adenine2030-N6)-methyltransferase
MNYRHAFHAGNHADVLKHVALLALCDTLMSKASPMFFWDVHAGAGVYDLAGDEAVKTGEADAGVAKVKALSTEPLQKYLDAIAACKAQFGANYYPGSPWLIQSRMREGDRLACTELHSEVVPLLRAAMKGDRRIAIHQADGYSQVRALLPPKDGVNRLNRGIVLLDPPYEAQLAEFTAAFAMVTEAMQRWAQGTYVLWYPIKRRRDLARIYRDAAALPAKSLLSIELLVREDDSPLRMNGSGLFIWNAPFLFDTKIEPSLHVLSEQMADGHGSAHCEWLKSPA